MTGIGFISCRDDFTISFEKNACHSDPFDFTQGKLRAAKWRNLSRPQRARISHAGINERFLDCIPFAALIPFRSE